MARLKKRLFGDGPILDEVLSSIAYGFGVPGASVVERRKAAEDQQEKARRMQREGAADLLKQQEFDLKKQAALGGQAAPMDLAAMLSSGVSPEYAALSGMTPPVAGGQAVPSPAGGLGEELMGGSPLASIPMQRDAADLPPNGELPPPVRSPQDMMYDYLDQFPIETIKPEKQSAALKMKGIADEMKNVTTEQGRMELERQFNDLAREARLEKSIIPPPPTAQEELQSRTFIGPDGVSWTQQPTKEGGTRLEANDAPARVELERKKLEQESKKIEQEDLKYRTETEIRLKEAMDRARAEEETRQKESESIAAQQKADQKKKADEESQMELQRNYDSWNESAMKRKPREDRMEAARKKIDADFKAKKLPYTHRDLPPQYIDNMVDKELDTEFQDYLRGVERNKVRMKNSIALSPQQELERLAESDPGEWQKKFDQTKRELGESGEDVSDPMVVINAMEESVANTPARLMAKRKEAQLAEALRLKQASEREDAVTTSPSDAIPARRLEPLAEGVEGASSPADWVRRMGSQRTAPQASDAEPQPQMTEPIGTDAIAQEPVLQGTEATAQDVQGNPLLRNLFGGQTPQAGQGGEQTLADMIRAEAGLPPAPRPEPAANPLREAPAEEQPASPETLIDDKGGEILPATHGDPEDIKTIREYAKKNKLDPKSITWDEAEQIRADRDALYQEDAKRDIVMTMIEDRGAKELPAMKKLEKALKDSGMEQKNVSRLIDMDVVNHFVERGSKSPIEDAANAILDAVSNKKLHVSLLDDETKAWVKNRYPVADPSDPLLETLGPGQKYITPWGEIKKTTRKAPPPRDASDKQTNAYINRDQDRARMERQTPR